MRYSPAICVLLLAVAALCCSVTQASRGHLSSAESNTLSAESDSANSLTFSTNSPYDEAQRARFRANLEQRVRAAAVSALSLEQVQQNGTQQSGLQQQQAPKQGQNGSAPANATQKTNVTQAANATKSQNVSATIAVDIRSGVSCTLKYRNMLDDPAGDFAALKRDCQNFIATQLFGDCTAECSLRARKFANMVAAHAGLHACILDDYKARNIVNALAAKQCGALNKAPKGVDLAFDEEGNPLTFTGIPTVRAGVSFAHKLDHADPDTTPVPRGQNATNSTKPGQNATQAKTNATQAQKPAQQQVAPRFQVVQGQTQGQGQAGQNNSNITNPCLPDPCVLGTRCRPVPPANESLADLPNTTVTLIKASVAKGLKYYCVNVSSLDAANSSGTFDASGKNVPDLNHTNVGKPLNASQIALFSPISAKWSQLAELYNSRPLTPDETAICVGPLGPLQRVREGCATFLRRDADKEALAALPRCPFDCYLAIKMFKLVVDSAPHVKRCLKLPTYLSTFTTLSSGICAPDKLGLVSLPEGAYIREDPLETGVNPASRNYSIVKAIIGKSPLPSIVESMDAQGGAGKGGQHIAVTPVKNATKVQLAGEAAHPVRMGSSKANRPVPPKKKIVLEDEQPNLDHAGLEAEDEEREVKIDPYLNMGYCKEGNDGTKLEIDVNGQPKYCIPRPPHMRKGPNGEPVYPEGQGKINLTYSPQLVQDPSTGSPIYPDVNSGKTVTITASQLKSLQKLLPPRTAQVLLVNVSATDVGEYLYDSKVRDPIDAITQHQKNQASKDGGLPRSRAHLFNRTLTDTMPRNATQQQQQRNATSNATVSNPSASIGSSIARMLTAITASNDEAAKEQKRAENFHNLISSVAASAAASGGALVFPADSEKAKETEDDTSSAVTLDATSAFKLKEQAASALEQVQQKVVDPQEFDSPEDAAFFNSRSVDQKKLMAQQQVPGLTQSLQKGPANATEARKWAPGASYPKANGVNEVIGATPDLVSPETQKNIEAAMADNARDVNLSPEAVAKFRAYFAKKLATLETAGYKDVDLNLKLLIKYHGDINKVIAVLEKQPSYSDFDDLDDAPNPQPFKTITRNVTVNVTVDPAADHPEQKEFLDSVTTPPASNEQETDLPLVADPIKQLQKAVVKAEELKKMGVPYFYTDDKPVNILEAGFNPADTTQKAKV